ncbi:response regulator [Candidatus Saganbacteria bacterium]|nr:response regulator [Candidatus Saganbacteria bacterium]
MLFARLNSQGFEVKVEANGMSGLKTARAWKPDLMILDIMLPEMDGYKVARLLKFDEVYKNIPIIMLTARTQDTDRQKGKEAGADAYITKPYEPEELMAKIKELLKG